MNSTAKTIAVVLGLTLGAAGAHAQHGGDRLDDLAGLTGGSDSSESSSDGSSTFDPDELIQGAEDLYNCYAGQCSDRALSEIDVAEIADALAAEIAMLPPDVYNDVLVHFLADYAKGADDRGAIELLFQRVYIYVADELRRNREHHPLLSVLDDALTAWTYGALIGGTYGLVRGVWSARAATQAEIGSFISESRYHKFRDYLVSKRGWSGSSVDRLDRFAFQVHKSASSMAHSARRAGRWAFAGGTTYGVVHAVLIYLQTKRDDPRRQLRAAQRGVLQKLAEDLAGTRRWIEQVQSWEVEDHPEQYASHFRDLNEFLDGAEEELAHLEQAAPFLRSDLIPARDDLQRTRAGIHELEVYIPDQDTGSRGYGSFPGSGNMPY